MRILPTQSASALSGWKRLAIILLAVPAILIGLLAMHVLTIGASHAHESASHVSMPVGESATAHQLEASNCDGLCGPEHDLLGMACILALLTTALLLTVHLTLSRWGSLPAVAIRIMARIAALAPPQPPSLLVLSISRT